jgi:Pvc16 N-terminal domain
VSSYKVINAVGETLREILWSAIQNDSTIVPGVISTETRITFEAPFKLIEGTVPEENSLSIFLYRIVENGDMKNRPFESQGTNLLKYPPLSLNLFYLISPLTNSAENNNNLLGKTMQIFYDNALMKGSTLQGVLANTAEELRIIFNPISMEDITKLWTSFTRHYHLSVSYEVKVIYIDSERETEAERVRRKRIEYTQLAGV